MLPFYRSSAPERELIKHFEHRLAKSRNFSAFAAPASSRRIPLDKFPAPFIFNAWTDC
jgi:hypothetical protein